MTSGIGSAEAILSSEEIKEIVAAALLPLVVALPVVSVWCFLFDGVYIGATAAAASATAGWLTSALSISIVLKRCPDTFNTSSIRPMIQ